MSEFSNRHEIKKTRKDHKCLGCSKIIPIGTVAIKNSGMFENEFYSYYLHHECEDFISKNSEYFDEGLWNGCVNEIRNEFKTK
ncbi:hypothetical protein OWO94_13240 [Bacillus paranthracis]|uniref:hypothetical protein n=1 Tax=Bacillus paranthracis TaxID=2026186 RepID=UPI00254F0038|nr:hypothetical protein [Bacillus paranthracis]MDK7537826.1 hypothetical protein [Bacillus paranthracis]MDK7560968.1 hypothetical protein [Bacillus paranthracis]